MATGFVQRWKGKIAVAYGAIFQSGTASSANFHNAGAPTNGTSGTLANKAGKGALLLDTTNGVLYQNTNTLASPTWTALTTATGAGTYTGTFDGVVGGVTPAAATVTTLTASGLITKSAADALTAHAGGGQASALALTKQINRVSTVATTADSVKLPASVAGLEITIINGAASNSMQVFGAGTDTINDVATGTGVAQAAGLTALYSCPVAGKWYRNLSA